MIVKYDAHNDGATGKMCDMYLREGMMLRVSDLTFGDDFRFYSYNDRPWVELSFVLTGGMTNSIPGYYARSPEKDGQAFLLLSGNTEGVVELNGGKRSRKVELMLDPDVWGSYIRRFWGYQSQDELLSKLEQTPFNVKEMFYSARIRSILLQMHHCEYEDELRQLFMESKCLELMTVCADEWGQPEPDAKDAPRAKLNRADIEKITAATGILLDQMEQPPSLVAIAKQVGLNDWKLKQGFKEVFGTTVFGYLRERRLEKALAMMEQGAANVNEAACAVGYNNPSYFAGAFRKKYGVNPSEFMRIGER